MAFKPLFVLSISSSLLLSGCFWDSDNDSGNNSKNSSSSGENFPANSLATERGFAADSADRWAFYVDGDTLFAVDGKNPENAPIEVDKITVNTMEQGSDDYQTFGPEVKTLTYLNFENGDSRAKYSDVVYVREGKLFKVSSNSKSTPTPMQLSNLSGLPRLCLTETALSGKSENSAIAIRLNVEKTDCKLELLESETAITYYIPMSSTANDSPLIGDQRFDEWQQSHQSENTDSNADCPHSIRQKSTNLISTANADGSEKILLEDVTDIHFVSNKIRCHYLVSAAHNGEVNIYDYNAKSDTLSGVILSGNWKLPSWRTDTDDFYIVSYTTINAGNPSNPDDFAEIAKIDPETASVVAQFKTDILKSEIPSSQAIQVIEESSNNLYYAVGPHFVGEKIYFKNLSTNDAPIALTKDDLLSRFNTSTSIVGNQFDYESLAQFNEPQPPINQPSILEQLQTLKGQDQINFLAKFAPYSFIIDKNKSNQVTTNPASPIWSSCVGLTSNSCSFVLGYTQTLHTIEFDSLGERIVNTGPASTDLAFFDGSSGTYRNVANFQASRLNFHAKSSAYLVLGETNAAIWDAINEGTEKHELFLFPAGEPEKLTRITANNAHAYWVYAGAHGY